MSPPRIAVIGFGFSGLMTVANLVREGSTGLTIYIIDPLLDAHGVAYGTQQPEHLLNVSASRMGAFADDAGGFYDWLQTPDGTAALRDARHHGNFASRDFAPRRVYARYLDAIWRDTQQRAAAASVQLKLVPSRATGIALSPLAVRTERGDAIAVDDVVLAVGHEFQPAFAPLKTSAVIQNPWAPGVFDGAAQWASPVVLLGTGLTAIDMLLMLRAKGYRGQVIAASRNGRLPQAHRHDVDPYALDVEALLAQKTLTKMLRSIRAAMVQHGDWRGVLDSLRPHTPFVWQRLSATDRRRFLHRLMPFWNTHRHRMAPQIALRVQHEIDTGQCVVIAQRHITPRMEAETLVVELGGKTVQPARIIHCMGPQLNVARSQRSLLQQALADGVIEPHATQLGITTDATGRAYGNVYPHLYAVGSLMTGQWLESVAVPELRVQAARVAQALLRTTPSA